MKKEPLEDELLDDSHIFLHPVRYRLVELLAEQPRHVNALSSALGMERRLVTYHLATLEEQGFVTSKYVISEVEKIKGKALRVYTVSVN
jgi:predicted transcriptional regulator